ncbi:methionine ABC transporter permease [uncultured Corynebacterium sp.]|uniref:methionine ABC transporter permease n=1 Tax=uncultured Corynebacterium sp. TaxID=159447 RepID=UPI0025FAA4E3|nr:methionine ABC transporter permease [uncultured Corynebacterium sp.]
MSDVSDRWTPTGSFLTAEGSFSDTSTSLDSIRDEISIALPDLWLALAQTGIMLLFSIPVTIVLGSVLGILLYSWSPEGLRPHPHIYRGVGTVVNVIRSFPFLVLMIVLFPVAKFVVGTSLGTVAVTVPLVVHLVPYFARLVEQNLREVPRGVIEAVESLGGGWFRIVSSVLLRESRSGIASSVTIMVVGFVSLSAMAGMVGGGGIGDFAIRYGYYRYETSVLILAVIVMVVIVQIVQLIGDRTARVLDKRNAGGR